MRQGLLAIALVLAAFLGGAAVNGHALAWIKAFVARSLDDSGAPPAPPAVDGSSPQVASKPAVTPDPKAKSPDAGTGAATTASAAPADEPPKPILPRPPFTLNFLGKKAPAADAPQDPTLKQVSTPAKDAPPAGSLALNKPEALPKVEPVVPAPVPPGSQASADVAGASGQDWKALRNRLKAAGVTRYTIEARPDGRAVFRCQIPVEGLTAVSQQFEAEADDEFLAAEAALRRVQLWRAAEETEPNPNGR